MESTVYQTGKFEMGATKEVAILPAPGRRANEGAAAEKKITYTKLCWEKSERT